MVIKKHESPYHNNNKINSENTYSNGNINMRDDHIMLVVRTEKPEKLYP